ncbi:chloroplast stem-loop binding protein of 41 kDa b, chloroplastic isoform X2 [Folsomia candida]|uniref:chloroplast stem-loop binding protein of 41 kDa b, chloroplastic isoform X2 n=1 Tax=Folsomia candida TaxID=158441 RepID=UPI0016055C64|nr:chloroplast stem-loop binding protein of 41 kDa b, chloroplastic isoform X2 [Folsomia candida]
MIVWWLALMMTCVAGDAASKGVKNVLAFGGNGFIGSEVLDALFTDPTQYYSVTLVSRGNWYFDSATRIKPKLHKTISCDREDSDLEFCTDLVTYIKETPRIDIVLDFSAYNAAVMSASLDLLNEKGPDKVGVYVFISSDSIYEVCRGSATPRVAGEEDDKRPESEEERNLLNEGDSYGNDKLECEELLRGPGNKIPYLIFRLPDVLGARDTTDRWWTYQMWIEFYDFLKVPLLIPVENRKLKTSYVYVKDVARAILLALNKPESWKSVYNLGLEEPLTLQEFFERMAVAVRGQGREAVTFDTGEFNVFPSVSRGSVTIEKAKRVLEWEPSTWETVFKETVPFYKEAFYKFTSERDDASNQLTRFVVPRHRKGEFLRIIDELAANPGISLDEHLATLGGGSNDQGGGGSQVTPEQLFEEMMTRTEL